MSMQGRRRVGAALMVAGVVLGAASAGPLSWGLGVLVAVAAIVGGWELATDRRADSVRAKRRW
jgi:hypothetical protein